MRFDRPRLGDVRGLDGLHLQCHQGTDTVSLSRLGARMTGLDLSSRSLQHARALAERAGERVDYVQADVYSAPLPGLMVENETGEYVLAERPRRLPASFTLAAQKS